MILLLGRWYISLEVGSLSNLNLILAENRAFVDGILSDGRFSHISGLAIDSRSNLYMTDFFNNAIRFINSSRDEFVSTLSGKSTSND